MQASTLYHSGAQMKDTGSVKTSLIFSIPDKVGGLTDILEVVKKHQLNMSRIESRPSKTPDWDYDFFVEFSGAKEENLQALLKELHDKKLAKVVNVTSSQPKDVASTWFPRKPKDLDLISEKVLEYGEELDADHPGFKDPLYRERRLYITKVAKQHKYGEKIPRIEYTPQEKAVWKTVYTKLKELYPTHACKQHNYVFPLLEQNCGYGPDNIPQLQDVSEFLQDCTGWKLRPVTGLLSSRDFLNAFAFRIFHSTQYIRHESKPFYTPEPDVCHELLGHVPLFADPDFADFSHEIGLASLGASDADIEKLATCYWFTVEFGLCKEGNSMKAFGAGLLSSYGELEHCLSDKPKKEPFDPFIAAVTKYPITQYQPLYYVTESFEDAKKKLIEFAQTLERPFNVRYNPYTQNVEVLDTKKKLIQLGKAIKHDIALLTDSLAKID